ncbi:MAG: spore coat U domain-containing protein [Pseudomonadota bacterium]
MRLLPAMLIVGAIFGGLTSPAWAGGCAISSTGLAFGTYQPLTFPGKLTSVDRTSDATVSIVCTSIVTGGSYSVALGASSVNNSMNPRLMANPAGGPAMQFNVYRDPAFTSIWGDGMGGQPVTGAIPVGNSNTSFAVYGKVPAGQSLLRVGSFHASLLMTITYNP